MFYKNKAKIPDEKNWQTNASRSMPERRRAHVTVSEGYRFIALLCCSAGVETLLWPNTEKRADCLILACVAVVTLLYDAGSLASC